MKRRVLNLIVALMVVASCLTMGACSELKPKLDIRDAKRNLERADYETEYLDADGLNKYIMEKALYAETDEDWIILIEFDNAKSAKAYFKDYDSSNKYEECYLEILQYVLSEYESNIFEDNLEYVKEDIDEYENEYEDFERGYSGKYVWLGTKQAIEDTKG